MTKQIETTKSRYDLVAHWVEQKADAEHRAALSASFEDEVSDDWLGDEGEEA